MGITKNSMYACGMRDSLSRDMLVLSQHSLVDSIWENIHTGQEIIICTMYVRACVCHAVSSKTATVTYFG